MSKLDVWRWAQYTLVGLLVATLIICTLLPDRGKGLVAKFTPTHVLPATLVIIAFGGYVIGVIFGNVSVTLGKVVTWAAFFVFDFLSKGTRNYRAYRMMSLELQADEFNVDISKDIPEYPNFLLELYRASEAHPQYLGGKIVSSWQSCTLLLSVHGCLMLGVFLSFGRLLVMLCIVKFDGMVFQFCLFLVLVVLYLLAGLALLERNRLLVRDVLISYVLRKESKDKPEDPVEKK